MGHEVSVDCSTCASSGTDSLRQVLIPLTQTDLAELAGATRPTVNRVLRALAAEDSCGSAEDASWSSIPRAWQAALQYWTLTRSELSGYADLCHPTHPRRTPMYGTVKDELAATLQEIEDAGLYKNERELTSPQSAHVTTLKAEAINFCANNYLGLADDPSIIESSKRALDEWGFGMASVRFICGTQRQHTDLERRIADFLGMEAAILYSSCFDANGGVFEVLFGAEDAIISDELNHASIIDGIRLSKAMRYRYKNADLGDLRAQLEAAVAAGAKRKVIVTDGVFSMDGSYAPLEGICDLADEFGALVFVDDSHAVGFIGVGGRGTPELSGVMTASTSSPARWARPSAAPPGLCRQPPGGRRPAAAALPAPTCSPTPSPLRRSRLDAGARAHRVLRREARDPAPQHRALRPAHARARFDVLPGTHPIRPVMFPGTTTARGATEIADHMLGRRLRHRVQLPRRAAREGSHPGPALGGAFGGRCPRVRRRVRRSQGRGGLSQAMSRMPLGSLPQTSPGRVGGLVEKLTPGYFALVMASGIISIGLNLSGFAACPSRCSSCASCPTSSSSCSTCGASWAIGPR